MKVTYSINENNKHSIRFDDLTDQEFDAIRILLQTASKYGKLIDEQSLSFQSFIDTFKENGSR